MCDLRWVTAQFAAEVDRIFMMKKQQDQQTAQLEEQITQLHQAAQQKIEQVRSYSPYGTALH